MEIRKQTVTTTTTTTKTAQTPESVISVFVCLHKHTHIHTIIIRFSIRHHHRQHMVLQIYTQMLSINYSFFVWCVQLLEEAPWADTWHRTSQQHTTTCVCVQHCSTRVVTLRNSTSWDKERGKKCSSRHCTEDINDTLHGSRTPKHLPGA